MKRCLFAALLGGLIAAAVIPANAAEALFRITCPDRWPGPDHRGIALSFSERWFDSQTVFGPDGSIVPPPNERSALLDCAYGEAARGSRLHGGVFSDLRMTVQVPGRARRCDNPPHGPRSSWCDTAPDKDGTIGPIRIYIAERPSLATSLLGFRLRQSAGDIRSVADAGGFTCIDDSDIWHCISEHDRIDILFKGDRSVAVRWLLPRDKPGEGGAYDRTVYRFGLRRQFDFNFETWQEPKSPVRLTFVGDKDPMVLALEDTSEQTPPAGRK